MTRSNEKDIRGIQEHSRNSGTELYKANLPLKLEIKYFGELRISEMDREDLSSHQATILEETIIRKSTSARNIIAIVKVMTLEDPARQDQRCMAEKTRSRVNISNILSIDVKNSNGLTSKQLGNGVTSVTETQPGPSVAPVRNSSKVFQGGDRRSVDESERWYTIRPNYRYQLPKNMVRWRSVPDVAPEPDETDCCKSNGKTTDDFSQTDNWTPEIKITPPRNTLSKFSRFKKAGLRVLISCTKCCF